jgi:hypothetical protein
MNNRRKIMPFAVLAALVLMSARGVSAQASAGDERTATFGVWQAARSAAIGIQ